MTLTIITLLLHLILAILLSREICNWLPTVRERTVYLVLLWLLPVAGLILAWRKVRPEWFTRESGEGGRNASLSTGLLGLDAIFNPGSAHVLEAQKRSEITIRMEGEMVDRELPVHIEIGDNAPIRREPETGPKD